MTGILIHPGGVNDKRALKLETKQGNHIPNEIQSEQLPEVIKDRIKKHSSAHSSAKLRSASSTYNCMGMIFASRRSWIETDHLNLIFTDDDYTKLSSFIYAELGDIVVYYNDENAVHVAIIIEITLDASIGQRNFRVLSQWGLACEWLHDIDDVPQELGIPKEVWTDRRK